MGISLMVYGVDPAYLLVARRLREKYNIDLAQHMESVTILGKNVQEGFWFWPKDSERLIAVLMATQAFEHDDRADLFHAMASMATEGEGYREISEKSIHCQISPSAVNMHIDMTGFLWRGPNGEALIGPDALFHILDELEWPKLVDWVSKKNKTAGKIVARIHPVLPTTANKFIPRIGGSFDVVRGHSDDFSRQWSLTLDFTWGCRSYACTETETLTGLNFTYKH
jgi:hypothetical protein